jgi:hypothetical protein
MRRINHFMLGMALSVLLSGGNAPAQFRFGAYMTTMYDDNVNNNYLGISDRVAQLSLQIARNWDSERHNTQVFYTGALTYYDQVSAKTFHYHSLGLAHSTSLGQTGQTTINAGATYSFRRNRNEYTFNDHRQAALYANLKHYLAERLLGRFNYSLRYANFSALPDFNYLEHYGFAQLTASLSTKTTIILETDLGTKIYTSAGWETSSAAGAMHGNGRGRQSTAFARPRTTQLIGIARVGQGLIAGTGLSLTAQYQINLQKEPRCLSSEYGIISDDELFDDHYGYEGLQTGLMLTQILPASVVMKINAGVQNRNYSERAAYDLAGNVLASRRVDTRRQLSALVEKAFTALGFSVSLVYDHIRNASNDYYYDYANHAVTAQMSIVY